MTAQPPSRDWLRFEVVDGDDYHGALAERRRADPVQRLLAPGAGLGGGVYAVYRREDVERILRDQETFTLDVVRRRYGAVLGERTMVSLDSTERRGYRSLLSGVLGPSAVQDRVAQGVVPAVEELLDDLHERRSVDLVRDFAARLPALAFSRVLGLSPDAAPALGQLSAAVAGFLQRPVAGVRAARALRRLLSEAISERRRTPPRADLIGDLCSAELDGQAVEEEDVLSLLILLVWAGTETTGPGLSNILYALLVHPVELRRLQDDPGLLSSAVDEGLRWETPVQWTCRTVGATTEVGGRVIPRDSLVLAHMGSANRDETHYADPAQFDVSRSPSDHLAFGHGPHYCIGSHLARAELRIALSALLARFPDISLPDAPAVAGQLLRCPAELPVRLRHEVR